MITLTTFFVAIISALCPLVNLELYLAGVGAFGSSLEMWPVAIAAGAGQACGKLIWHELGRSSMQWSFIKTKMQSPKWQRRYEQIRKHTDNGPWARNSFVFMSATVGLPPVAIMAVVSGQLRFPRVSFVVTTFVGRTLRFAIVLGGSTWLAHGGFASLKAASGW